MAERGGAYSYEIDRSGPAPLLRLNSTHFHADSYETLGEALKRVSEGVGGGAVIVDFSKVLLFSSTALRALRSAHLALDAQGGRIVAAGGGELVTGVLRFAPFIRYFETVDDAEAFVVATRNAGKGRT